MRDAALGKVLFRPNDWARTKIAYDILEPVKSLVDIGIGQGQLVNIFSELPHVEAVHGVDFQKHSKLLEPEAAMSDVSAYGSK